MSPETTVVRQNDTVTAKPSVQLEEETASGFLEKVFDPNYLPSLAEAKRWLKEPNVQYRLFIGRHLRGDDAIFEFITQEFVDVLADYIARRVRLYSRDNSPIVVLETGAGSGRLSHFLREGLSRSIPGQFQLIATDSGKRGIPASFPVETLDYREALKKYDPTIIITSWMPLGEDWTPDYRAAPNVREYILIGEAFETCGAESTWEEQTYQSDGFARHALNRVSRRQVKFASHLTSTHTFKRANR